MKKYTFYISIVGLLIAASAVLSCSNKKNDRGGRTDTPTSGTITFYADESFSPIIEEERNSLNIPTRRHISRRYIRTKIRV